MGLPAHPNRVHSAPMRRAPIVLFAISLFAFGSAACDSKPKTNPFENKNAPVAPPPIKETPKPTGPPDFVVSAEGPKVGWTYVLLEKADGKQKLAAAVGAQREWVSGKEVKVRAARQAKIAHVAEMLRALTEAGASSIVVQ